MKIGSAFLCALVLLTAAVAGTQTPEPQTQPAAQDESAITGVWRAEADGLPFVTLTITNETGKLSGAVLFYIHRRDEGKPVTSTPGIPEPLFNMNFDGNILTFEVSHRRAHPPRTLSDPPVTFRMKLTGANTSAIFIGDHPNENISSPGIPLLRTDY